MALSLTVVSTIRRTYFSRHFAETPGDPFFESQNFIDTIYFPEQLYVRLIGDSEAPEVFGYSPFLSKICPLSAILYAS